MKKLLIVIVPVILAVMTASRSAPGAQPPFEYQIKHASAIVLCRTEIQKEGVRYRILETWKGKLARPADRPLEIDTKIFELLGYRPQPDEKVVLFFFKTASNGQEREQPIELLPVRNGKITYAPADSTVTRTLTPAELKDIIESQAR